MSSPALKPGTGLFSISPLNNLSVQKQVHLHDYHEVCLIERGSFTLQVDQEEITIDSPSVCCIWSGQIHRIVQSDNPGGSVITFPHNFFPHLEAEDLGFFLQALYQNSQKINYINLDDSQLAVMRSLFTKLAADHQISKDSFGYRESLQAGLLQILILLIRLGADQLNGDSPSTRTLNTYYSFLALLETNYSKQSEIAFYASKLGIASRHLNDLLRRNSGKTFKETLLDKKCYEAKKLIAFTSFSFKEIAYQLGCKSQSYFCYSFRKGAGLTPGQYREKTSNRSN